MSREARSGGSRLGPFRHSAYTVYWLGVAISSLGTWLTAVAGSIYIYQLTGSTFSVGVVNFAGFVPILLFSMLGGGLSDRFDRRAVALATHVLSVVVGGALAWLTIAGLASELVLIVAFFLLNTLWALGKPSLQALVPNIVPREDLQDAVALASLAFMTGQIAGPLVAAVALAVSGAGLAFAINAATYVAPVAALIVLVRMGLGAPDGARAGRAADASGGAPAGSYLRRNNWVVALLAGVVVTSTAMEIQRTLSPALASERLGIAESNAGLLLAAQSVGSAISFLLFVWIRRRGWSRPAAYSGLGLQAVGVVVAAYAPILPLSMAGFFLIGLGFAMCFPVLTATLQDTTPDAYRGRLLGYHQLALLGHRPLTALVVGSLATAFGLVTGLLAWLILVPAGLVAIRAMWRGLPDQPAGRSGPESRGEPATDVAATGLASS